MKNIAVLKDSFKGLVSLSLSLSLSLSHKTQYWRLFRLRTLLTFGLLMMFMMQNTQVQGQVLQGTGGELIPHDSCVFQTDTFYGNTFIDYFFVSDATNYELSVQGREFVKNPIIFENFLLYNNNDSLLNQYDINLTAWSQSFSVPSIGDTFKIRLEIINTNPWYDFDICLTKDIPFYLDFSTDLGAPTWLDPTTLQINCLSTTLTITPYNYDYIPNYGFHYMCEVYNNGNMNIVVFSNNQTTGATINLSQIFGCFDYVKISGYYNNCGNCLIGPYSYTYTIFMDKPTVSFTHNDVCLGDEVCFDETTYCAMNLQWDFANGYSASGSQPCHFYTQSGQYNVTLQGENGAGCVAQYSEPVIVSEVEPFTLIGPESACDIDPAYSVTPFDPTLDYYYSVDNGITQTLFDASLPFYYYWSSNGGTLTVYAYDNYTCSNNASIFVTPCCENPIFGEPTYYNETFTYSTNTITGKDFYFNGEIIFSNGSFYQFIECTFYMGVNAKIIIENKAIVQILKNGLIESCDPLMWDGIYILNGGKLYVSGQNSSSDILIKDAKNAVVSIDGGEYEIHHTTFDKNHYHLKVKEYFSSHSGKVTLSEFICSGTLLPQHPPIAAYRTQNAIDITNVSSIEIGKRTKGNLIENCDVGIYARNSFIRVVGNTFKNIEPGSIAFGQPTITSGFGIINASIDLSSGNPYGISTMPATFSIHGGNTFTNVRNGILSFNNGNVLIRDNKLTLQNNQYANGTAIIVADFSPLPQTKIIVLNDISGYNRGIHVGNTTNARISGNIIKNVKNINTSLFSSTGTGILVEGSANSVIQGNSVLNTGIAGNNWKLDGIHVSITNNSIVSCNTVRNSGKSIHFSGECYPAQIKKNLMQSGIAGFVLSNGGYTGPQGINGEPWDNEWKNSFSYHLYTTDNSTYGSLSEWYIGTSTPFTYPSGFTSSGVFYMPYTITSGSLFLLCAMPHSATPISFSTTMTDIANASIPELQQPNYRKWMNENGLMKNLRSDTSLLQYPALSSFEQQQINLSTGKLLQIEDSLLANNLSGALTINTSLQTYSYPDSIKKMVNDININAVASGADDWSSSISTQNWNKLREIASCCPFEYGTDVYLARIMLKLYGDTTYYVNVCEEIAEPVSNKNQIAQEKTENFTRVFPNPASNVLNIETSSLLPAKMVLYSIVGQIIKTIDIVEPYTEIDISDIESGIILYKISNNNNRIQVGTVNIIK